MKTNSHDEQGTHNLVMFPSSKNFNPEISLMDLGADPLNDLLNEYAHLTDEDIPDHLDERFEADLLENDQGSKVFHSLEAFMGRNLLRSESQAPDDKLMQMINDRIKAISEAKDRIKFYLEEIEIFLPNRKRLPKK